MFIPRQVQVLFFNVDSTYNLLRDMVRKIMHDNFPSGFNERFPGKKRVSKKRGHLDGIGVFQELHCDGHEKLGPLALRMGPVGVHIYGMRCHASGFIVAEQVVPNGRCEVTVAHCYFDVVDAYGGMSLSVLATVHLCISNSSVILEIPLQITVDGGNETGHARAGQITLR